MVWGLPETWFEIGKWGCYKEDGTFYIGYLKDKLVWLEDV